MNDIKKYNFIKREIALNLTDEDWCRVEERCEDTGITINELLVGFVSDLVNGSCSWGRDERLCVNHWFDRRYYD